MSLYVIEHLPPLVAAVGDDKFPVYGASSPATKAITLTDLAAALAPLLSTSTPVAVTDASLVVTAAEHANRLITLSRAGRASTSRSLRPPAPATTTSSSS